MPKFSVPVQNLFVCKQADYHQKATHIVAEDPNSFPTTLPQKDIVSVAWLEACLARHANLPVDAYIITERRGIPYPNGYLKQKYCKDGAGRAWGGEGGTLGYLGTPDTDYSFPSLVRIDTM